MSLLVCVPHQTSYEIKNHPNHLMSLLKLLYHILFPIFFGLFMYRLGSKQLLVDHICLLHPLNIICFNFPSQLLLPEKILKKILVAIINIRGVFLKPKHLLSPCKNIQPTENITREYCA